MSGRPGRNDSTETPGSDPLAGALASAAAAARPQEGSKSRLSSASLAKAISRVPARPRRLISTRVPRAARSRSSAARVLASARGGRRRAGRAQQRHPALHLAHGEALARGLPGQRHLVLGPLEGEEGAGVAGVEPALGQELAHLAGQPQQAQRVGDGRAVAPHPLRDLLLGEARAPRCRRWKACASSRGVSSSRWMFSTRASSSRRSSGTSRTMTGTVARPSCLGGPPAPLARDDLVALAPPPHEDGLDDPALADGGGQLAGAARARCADRGWKGIGLEARRPAPRPRSTSGDGGVLQARAGGRRAPCRAPSLRPFMGEQGELAVGHDLLGEVQVGLGPLRPDVVEEDRLAEARRLGQADAPRDRAPGRPCP